MDSWRIKKGKDTRQIKKEKISDESRRRSNLANKKEKDTWQIKTIRILCESREERILGKVKMIRKEDKKSTWLREIKKVGGKQEAYIWSSYRTHMCNRQEMGNMRTKGREKPVGHPNQAIPLKKLFYSNDQLGV